MKPVTVQGDLRAAVLQDNYKYEYPDGLDFHPLSELHQTIIGKVQEMLWASRNESMKKEDQWTKSEMVMTASTYRTDEENKLAFEDPRKPISIAVPVSYSIREALLTQTAGTLLASDVYFPVDPMQPEDTPRALLLQNIIQAQAMRSKMELDLITQWSDGLTYGVGILCPQWKREYGLRSVVSPILSNSLDGLNDNVTGYTTDLVNSVIWEGNVLNSIHPRNYLPDPYKQARSIQDAMFVGWMSRESRMSMLAAENQGEGYFNCKYIRYCSGSSGLYKQDTTEQYNSYNNEYHDITPICVTLIPEEWGLGSSIYPEKWMFVIVDMELIIWGSRITFKHNCYPISVCTPNIDYTAFPTAKLDLIQDLQTYISWILNAQIQNWRKTINNVYVVDQENVVVSDVKNVMSQAGGIIRTRKNHFGKGVTDLISQLPTVDVTQNAPNIASYMIGLVERITGASGALQGVLDANAPERRTKAEFQGVTDAARGRLSLLMHIMHATSMRDIGKMLVHNTQQFLSEVKAVRLLGDMPTILMEEYGMQIDPTGTFIIDPLQDLDCDFDIMPIHPGGSMSQDPESAFRLLNFVATNPALAMRYDQQRMFESLARKAGDPMVRNYRVQVMPDQQYMNEVADGNLVPTNKSTSSEGKK